MDPSIYFTILGTMLGALISGPLTYYFATKLIRKQEFNQACATFKIAFIEEMRFIDRFYAVDRAGRDIPEVLAAATDSHERALLIFKEGFLCEKQRVEIEKAWKEYTGETKLTGKYTFAQYATKGNFKEEENIRKLALARIEKLLEFAKHK